MPKWFITSQVDIALFNYSVHLVTCGVKLISQKHFSAPSFASLHTLQCESMLLHMRYFATRFTSESSAIVFTQ